MNANGLYPARHARRGFTLVELLVVVGLMAVILTLTVSNFMMSSGGAKVQSAIMQLKSNLSLARQYALTRRETIYMVFAEPTTVNPEMAYKAYNVWSSRENAFLGNWIALPEGTYFNWTTNSTSGINVFWTNAVCRFAVTNLSANAVAAFSFLPNGRLNQTGGSGIEIFISEGSLVPGTTTVLAPAQSTTKSLFVYPLTGHANVYE